jgi:hypothetical protein
VAHISRFVCIIGGNNSSQRRESWKLMHMVTAVNAVRRMYVGLKKGAKSFNILKFILKECAEKDEHDAEKMELGNLGMKPVLPPQLEKVLLKYEKKLLQCDNK